MALFSPSSTSRPGVGVRTAARLLTEVTGRHFPIAGHLAAYAGLPRRPTIRHLDPRRVLVTPRERDLKDAMFLSAFAALRDPESRAYYDRKITQGKRHNQALLALERRRCDVLFAMLRDGTVYQSRPTEPALAA